MTELRDPRYDPEFRFAAQIKPTVDNLVGACSVPIFAANLGSERRVGGIVVVDGPPVSGVASGTLLAVSGAHFVVTAAHVLRQFDVPGHELRIGMGDPQRPQPLPIPADRVEIDDAQDVAAVLLTPDVVSRLPGKRFLTLTDIALDPAIGDWYCLLFGYLWEGTQPNRDYSSLILPNFRYWTRRYDGSMANPKYDAASHSLVEFHEKAWSLPDGIKMANPSSLGGLSGAALWRVFRPEHAEGGWSPPLMKVIAVENVVYDDRIIGCTNFAKVLPLFEALAPELRP
jgi:hypothetical protein